MTAGVTIRRIAPADFDAADRVLRAAFAQPYSFVPNMRIACAIEPDGFLVAEHDSRIIGSVAAVDYGNLAYVGFMAVDPALQGRGIGRLLVERLLKWLDGRGCPSVLLDATAEGARLYEQLGFVDDGTANVFAAERWTELTQDELHLDETMSESVVLARPDDLNEIAAFDAPRFGADRHKLLAALWPEHNRRCLAARDGTGKLSGYLFARDPVLGPWVAADSEVADTLLTAARSARFDLPYSRAPLVMAPRSNEQARALLSRRGFHEERRLRHMRRGGSGPHGVRERVFGQSSFAHG